MPWSDGGKAQWRDCAPLFSDALKGNVAGFNPGEVRRNLSNVLAHSFHPTSFDTSL
jgi:hypothetical protein